MAQCIFTNLTPSQAITLAQWYSGQGEQDADIWFDEWCGDGTPMADCGREGGYIETLDNGDVIAHCK